MAVTFRLRLNMMEKSICFSDGFDHFLRRYEHYVDDEQSVSKLFVRLGLLELQERNGQGEVTAQNVWRPDLVGSTLRSPNGISQE